MEEVKPAVEELKPQISMILKVSDQILSNESIRDFFAYILTLGNFINMVRFYNYIFSPISCYYT